MIELLKNKANIWINIDLHKSFPLIIIPRGKNKAQAF